MKRTTTVLFGLVTAILISAATAAASPTLPEWGRCMASDKGEYSDAGCTDKVGKGKGSYDWKSALSVAQPELTSQSSEAVIEGVNGNRLVYASEAEPMVARTRSAAEAAKSSFLVGIVVTFRFDPRITFILILSGGGPKEVKQVVFSFPAGIESGTGASCEEIKTTELHGALGYISGSGSPDPSVGLNLKTKGPIFAEFACPAAGRPSVVIGRNKRTKLGGSVISRITPVDEMTTEFTQVYSESAPGIQNPTKFETGNTAVLEASFAGPNGPFEQAALTSTTSDTSREPIEIRAYCNGC
jgi:hypothetical protein